MKRGVTIDVIIGGRLRRISANEAATLSVIRNGNLAAAEVANIIRLHGRGVITRDGRLPPEVEAMIGRFEELSDE